MNNGQEEYSRKSNLKNLRDEEIRYKYRECTNDTLIEESTKLHNFKKKWQNLKDTINAIKCKNYRTQKRYNKKEVDFE